MHFLTNRQDEILFIKILRYPHASTNLLSINKFCLENNYYRILTGSDFTAKENQTGRTLLHRRVEIGIYPIAGNVSLPYKIHGLTATIGEKTSAERWHYRLGHPSHMVFQSLFRSSCISLSPTANKSVFCSDCPLGKSKQMPFQIPLINLLILSF